MQCGLSGYCETLTELTKMSLVLFILAVKEKKIQMFDFYRFKS